MISNSNSSLWSAFLCVPSQALSPPSLLLSVPRFPSWGKGIKAAAGYKAAGLLHVPQAEVPCQEHDQMSLWSENLDHSRTTGPYLSTSQTLAHVGHLVLAPGRVAVGQQSLACLRPGTPQCNSQRYYWEHWRSFLEGLQTLCGTCCLLFPMYNMLESDPLFEEWNKSILELREIKVATG